MTRHVPAFRQILRRARRARRLLGWHRAHWLKVHEWEREHHRAHCGPARGFKICYCECSDCRAPADENGNRRCICVGCRGWEHDRG